MKTLANPTHAPKNIKPVSVETKGKRTSYMSEKTAEYLKIAYKLKVKISKGNRKTGDKVPSVSLRPIMDCGNCKSCSGLCYDFRNDCMYPNVMDTRCQNYAIWRVDPNRYFKEISDFCKKQVAFRWHVGGDILTMSYLKGMVKVAEENPQCKFLAFTKMFRIINKYLSENELPENLQIIFSGWVGLNVENPYNLPTSHPKFYNGETSASEDAFKCKGNCTKCFENGEGCWTAKVGNQIVFSAH